MTAPASNAGTTDYLTNGTVAPQSVEESNAPLSNSFSTPPEQEDTNLHSQSQWHRFWTDSTLTLNFRTIQIDRNNEVSNDNTAWAGGGFIHYESGYFWDRVKLGATYYTSQRIHAPKNEGGAVLLKPVQNGFDALGESYLQVQLTDTINFRGYRHGFDLPYLNRHDSKMVPTLHEAYTVTGLKVADKVDFITGYVHKIKLRNSDQFRPLSKAAGASKGNHGLFMAGARYSPVDHFDIGVINYYSFDIINILYAETNLVFYLTDQIPIKLSAQYTHQQSIGDEDIGHFNTQTAGIKASVSKNNVILTAAATTTADGQHIRSPYGGRPSYLSIINKSFDRAGEDAWLLGASYNFSDFGLRGLSIFSNYATGNLSNIHGQQLPDQSEWDLTLDYQPRNSFLNGLKLRYRRAEVYQNGPNANDSRENQFILNYEIPLR